ncbi:MAG TPA: dihydrodipicolinate synthase family protein [Candidatus Paceibacterota bacterium]|nr:dihydrodipicolinate synthase family protein [Verrucomicrobiota bacterium]HOX01122.1 dihydrodipicolinate synthase family protein [Verrucomicrobiota bacterium]HRZ44030.1 dihydrodipicolinate synthase family protein [Candidatus Paceibacterota bacterium]HRZ91730.1 dihydrodipicolinate synthase family protein [Candidatus Paceibacterota bacterium]
MQTQPTLPLRGLVAATHTPFHADGSLNLDIVERQASHLIENGVRVAFIGGSTGESHSLTVEERRLLAQRWFEATRGGPLAVIVHVGSNCLADARALAAQAEQCGALAIAALSPSYFRPRDLDILTSCCASIAGAAPRTPFYFYDIPSLTGVNLSMPQFLAQAGDRIPTLAGIKFTNSDLMSYQLCLSAAGGRFDIPYGSDEWVLAALALGAKGAVGSTYNFAAPVYHQLLDAFEKGDIETARARQMRSVQLVRLLAGYGYMGAAKAVMGMIGVDVGPARLPNRSLTPPEIAQLRRELEQLGFFDWVRR